MKTLRDFRARRPSTPTPRPPCSRSARGQARRGGGRGVVAALRRARPRALAPAPARASTGASPRRWRRRARSCGGCGSNEVRYGAENHLPGTDLPPEHASHHWQNDELACWWQRQLRLPLEVLLPVPGACSPAPRFHRARFPAIRPARGCTHIALDQNQRDAKALALDPPCLEGVVSARAREKAVRGFALFPGFKCRFPFPKRTRGDTSTATQERLRC